MRILAGMTCREGHGVMQAIPFDLDGVFYQENALLSGAAETLAWVRAEDIPHHMLKVWLSISIRAGIGSRTSPGMSAT